MKDRKLTVGLVRPGAMGGQIGVYDEHANLVRSLTTQHRDDKILSLSSNGNIGTVTYEEVTGRRWVRTYNLEDGNIIGNWKLPDAMPMQRAQEKKIIELKQRAPQPSEGNGGGIVIAILLFVIVINYVQTHLVLVIVCTILAVLVYLAIKNTEDDSQNDL